MRTQEDTFKFGGLRLEVSVTGAIYIYLNDESHSKLILTPCEYSAVMKAMAHGLELDAIQREMK